MPKFFASVRQFVNREGGATMVEYGLMLALIAVVCVVAVGLLGTNANTIYTSISGSI